MSDDVVRITIGLVPKAQRDIDYLQRKLGMTKSDIVNLGVSTMAFMQRKSSSGKEWIARDKETKEAELVFFSWQSDEVDACTDGS